MGGTSSFSCEISCERKEEDADLAEVDTSVLGKKRKVQDAMDIKLPYLPNTMIIVDDMLGKVPKLRYTDDDVCDAAKFLYLAKDTYLINPGKIGPLGKPIMEPA